MPRKKARGSKKGSPFERELCVALSLWWTGGENDDVFWRSATSGARATTRAKRGKQTRGHYGDICATIPEGELLTRVFTIEAKRGYPKAIITDLVDRNPRNAIQPLEDLIVQAHTAHINANSFAWLLIHRRDQRQSLVWMPQYAYDAVKQTSRERDRWKTPYPLIRLTAPIATGFKPVKMKLVAFLLSHFYEVVNRRIVKDIDVKLKKGMLTHVRQTVS